MTVAEKRKLRRKIQTGLTNLLCNEIASDEEYFIGLLYANQELGMMLSRFDDMYDEGTETEEEEPYIPQWGDDYLQKYDDNNGKGY